MRHVLVLTTSYPRFSGDPAGHFVESSVHELLARGDRVTVFAGGAPPSRPERPASPPPAEPSLRFLGAPGVFDAPGALARLRQNPLRAFTLLGPMTRFFWAVRELPPVDVVVMHWLVPSAWPGLFLLRAAGLDLSRPALQCVLHGSDARLVAALPAPLRSHVVRSLQRAGVRLTFVSRALQRTLRSSVESDRALADWIDEGNVAPAPLGPLATFDRSEARRARQIPEDARLLVVVGRLVRSKRVSVALTALDCVPDANVVVIGDGPERARLEPAFPNARFLGALPRDETLAWIAAADCLVTASSEEGAPTVVREARALGARVVTVDSGDVAAWASQDRGILVVGGAS